MYDSSWRLPPAHFRNGAGSILKTCLTYVASVTQAETVTALGETTSHHRHPTSHTTRRFFPIFHAVFCSVRRSLSLESALSFADLDQDVRTKQPKKLKAEKGDTH